MRFLFVYQDFAKEARELVRKLAVSDVTVIVVRRNEDYPSREELELLGCNMPAAAVCQVVRKYKKNLRDLVTLEYEAKSFRQDDLQLAQWLQPAPTSAAQPRRPSEAFEIALSTYGQLKAARHALDAVDEIHERRWAFVESACTLLGRYAQGENLGPMREWEARFGVSFAANGRVSHKCYVPGQKQPSPATEWHLKDGDKTTADDAPRIYFDVLQLNEQRIVVVFYAGPHPSDGAYSVTLDA